MIRADSNARQRLIPFVLKAQIVPERPVSADG